MVLVVSDAKRSLAKSENRNSQTKIQTAPDIIIGQRKLMIPMDEVSGEGSSDHGPRDFVVGADNGALKKASNKNEKGVSGFGLLANLPRAPLKFPGSSL